MVSLRAELSADFDFSDTVDNSDIIIVNSCAVTAETESSAGRLLSSFARLAPGAQVLVTGCLAQLSGERLRESHPNVAWVVGNGFKKDIPALLATCREGVFIDRIKKGILDISGAVGSPGDGGFTRFPIKIQEGCDASCAYCIVPRLRGPSRCAPAPAIIGRCRQAIDAGYKEIVIAGTHIGQYCDDSGTRLWPLLEQLLLLDGDFRLRLSTLDPGELSDDLLGAVGSSPKMCAHLHLSMQSFSPEMLLAMNRREQGTAVKRLFDFRAQYPHAGLGVDLIVGFPGETETMFQMTLDRTAALGCSYGHVFRFSARPKTAAAALPGQLPEEVKTIRSRKLRAVIDESRGRFIQNQAGTRHRIIVEQGSVVRGVTSNYLSVEVLSCQVFHNEWLDVILDGTAAGLRCGASRLSLAGDGIL
jgi:threonylcarbamoyladenosine tRNA methylthiotransferase MtaB